MILNSYPKLDVHGETRDTVVYPVKAFIQDNLKMQKEHIIIIHGIGKGILKEKIHEILKSEKSVIEFHVDNFNLGVTEITLKKVSKFDK